MTRSKGVLLILACLGAGGVHAENLMDAYRQARQSDPVLQQAEAQRRAISENVNQARAVLLPQINASGSFSDEHGTSTSNQPVDNGSGFQVFTTRSSSSSTHSFDKSATLDQTLFDFGKFAGLRASHAQAASGNAQYQAAEQDLILRTATAYFNVLTAEDELRFAQANEQALAKQLDQAQQRFNVGLSAITDVDAAKAQHDAAAASVIQAQNVVFDNREALSQITGQPVGTLNTLIDNLPLNKPQPDAIDAWVDLALRSNPSLQAQRDQVDAFNHDITVARAGHLPTLNAQVSYTNSPSWGDQSGGGLPGSAHFDSGRHDTIVGLVLQVPIFSGGLTQSRVRQAVAQRDEQSDIFEQDRRNVVRNTRSAFNAIEAGISEVEAQRQAVISAQKALEATQAGFEVGTRTIVDVLISQQNLFQAQSNYTQARHAFVVNQLTLKDSAGTLDVKDLETVNALLQ
ncbi:MAG TPA: TolC family outer membrane protein [Rhodanobacteraceae bacterium]|nr:TolC family outer membrane protein [Rhodanobacteraceae bacterium]